MDSIATLEGEVTSLKKSLQEIQQISQVLGQTITDLQEMSSVDLVDHVQVSKKIMDQLLQKLEEATDSAADSAVRTTE